MRGLILIGVLMFCGCGASVTKGTGGEKAPPPTPIVPPPEPQEIYDKVAPMPREVKRPDLNQ
jgi:hypothetical protein